MANEAVIRELLGEPKGKPVSFTVSDAVGIEKGTLLTFVDPRYASAGSAPAQSFAGIASTEKVANDGNTHIGAWTCGIFDMVSDAATAGTVLMMSGGNIVKPLTPIACILSGCVVGRALETASGNETIQVAVGLG